MAIKKVGKARDRHERLRGWFWQEMARQAANRYQMAKDEDYYDSLQWSDEEAAAVLARDQFPISWNEVAAQVDFLIGTERRTRHDFKVMARNDMSPEAQEDAELKTHYLKYLNDVNRMDFERSAAFDDCVKAGLGWIEVGVRGDPEQDAVYGRHEPWRNMLYDSLGQSKDINEDCRYLFRFKWVDIDLAKAAFPGNDAAFDRAKVAVGNEPYMEWWHGKRIDEYEESSSQVRDDFRFYDGSAWLNNPRERVMLIECWHKEPSNLTTGKAVGTYDRSFMRMRCTVITDNDVIADDWTPYKHNRFPFVPLWCYRRKRDNAPYGVIRRQRGPQDAINKSMSKAIWEVSSNQIMLETSALDTKVMNLERLREEIQKPDGTIVLAPGALQNQRIKNVDRQTKLDGHLKIVEVGTQALRTNGGVTGENRGIETSDRQSGKAVELRQEQGSLTTAEIFDNQLLAHQLEGELELSVLEQYGKESRTFSVQGERNKFDYFAINMVDEETGQVIGDVTARQSNFVIGEQSWRQSLAQAAFQTIMQLLGDTGKMEPKLIGALLPGALELADLPNKQSMIRNVRKVFGQPDPDQEQTPEEQQEMQKQQLLAEAQFEAQLQGLRAEVAEAKAKGEKLDAETVSIRVKALYEASQLGQIIVTVPHVAPVADAVARSAGFVDQDADPLIPDAPAAPAPAVEPLPELQQADGLRTGIETPTGADNLTHLNGA